MQVVETSDDASRVTYSPRAGVTASGMPAEQVDRIYPRPSLDLCYRLNLCFEDRTPTGQVHPGFDVTTPELAE